MSKNVLVILADGFEEIEAVTPIDVLRRAGCIVTIAALDNKDSLSDSLNNLSVRGAHNVYFKCDELLSKVVSKDYDAIVLPGGMPGAKNLSNSSEVGKIIRKTYDNGRLVCAICASPAYVLGPTGILNNKKCTCYPGCEEVAPNVHFGHYRAVKDGNIITAAGPGTALEFSLLMVQTLFGKDVATKLHSDMICN